MCLYVVCYRLLTDWGQISGWWNNIASSHEVTETQGQATTHHPHSSRVETLDTWAQTWDEKCTGGCWQQLVSWCVCQPRAPVCCRIKVTPPPHLSPDWRMEFQTKAKRKFAKISQLRRRPLLGPSPSWKCLLVLSHLHKTLLRHYPNRH